MDVFEAIQGRRSVRKFKKNMPVEEEKLQKVLEACRAAPSSKNKQPWEFIIIRNKDTLREIAEETAYGKFLSIAPIGVAIVLDPAASQTFYMTDGGILAQNFALAAHALGLGTCWIGTMDRDRVKEILGVPADKYLLTVLPLGYPEGKPQLMPRKKLKEMLHYEKYEQHNP